MEGDLIANLNVDPVVTKIGFTNGAYFVDPQVFGVLGLALVGFVLLKAIKRNKSI